MSNQKRAANAENTELLRIQALRIEAQLHGEWAEIVKGVDLVLRRRELVGLIGESGAGKSTIGLAAMGHVRNGCRISGGSVLFDGIELRDMDSGTKRSLLGVRIAYVAVGRRCVQSGAYDRLAGDRGRGLSWRDVP